MHFSYVALLLLAASAAAPSLAAPTFEKPRELVFPVVDSNVSAPLAVRNLDRLGLQSRYDDQDKHLNARNFLTNFLSKLDSAAKAISKIVLVGVDTRDIGLQSRNDDQDKHLNARNFLTNLLSKLDSAAKAISKIVLVGVDTRDIGLQSEYDDQDKHLGSEELTARRDVDHSITRSSTPDADPDQIAAIINAIFSGLEGNP